MMHMTNGVKIDIRKETDRRLTRIRNTMYAEDQAKYPEPKKIPYNAVICWMLDRIR